MLDLAALDIAVQRKADQAWRVLPETARIKTGFAPQA
jgi:hypothetical protein